MFALWSLHVVIFESSLNYHFVVVLLSAPAMKHCIVRVLLTMLQTVIALAQYIVNGSQPSVRHYPLHLGNTWGPLGADRIVLLGLAATEHKHISYLCSVASANSEVLY